MSFDLAVWDAERPPRVAEAEQRYGQLCRGEDPFERPSPRVTAFVEECEQRWPGDAADSPWATWPLRRLTCGFVANIRPEAATAMFGEWGEMVERHGLVLYDPQSGVIKIPSRLSSDPEPPTLPGRRRGRKV